MRNNLILPELFINNRKKTTDALKKNSVAVLFSNDEMPRNGDQFFAFRQNSDLMYLSGISQENTILLLFPDNSNEKEREIIFVEKPDPVKEIWNGKLLTKEEIKEISGIQNVLWTDAFDMVLRKIAFSCKRIYLSAGEMPKSSPPAFQSGNRRRVEEIMQKFPLHRYERLAPILAKLRMVKEKQEIELIRKACTITKSAFERVARFVCPGISEYEAEAEITHEFIRLAADGHAYLPIIASGKNACYLHYVKNNSVCTDNSLLLMDFGAEYRGYAADLTRVIPVSGKFNERQKKVYNSVLNVLKKAKEIYVVGTTISIINLKVRDFVYEELVSLGLAQGDEKENGKEEIIQKYFMHGTAHFLGLDVHDSGENDAILKAGMLLTCEPGIYIFDENIGIRLENDILITENGPIDLFEDIALEIDDIEKLMQYPRK